MKVFAGNSNRHLAEAICTYLNVPLGKASVRRFADQEIFVEIQENVRGEDVFVVQSTSFPTNDHLMELLIMIDAMRRSSARRITAVLPYFGYARQDRRASGRTPISAKLVANLITEAGADRVLTLDLHAGQIQGFFDIPTDNLYAVPVLTRDIKANYDISNVMVVSPDVGGVVRARSLAKRLDCLLAIVDKRRDRPGKSEVMNIIGDVEGKDCLLIDDIVNSGGTLCNAADALLAQGAAQRHRLHHARRSFRGRGHPHYLVEAARAGDHQLDPADHRRPVGPQYPRHHDRNPYRRSDQPHQPGRISFPVSSTESFPCQQKIGKVVFFVFFGSPLSASLTQSDLLRKPYDGNQYEMFSWLEALCDSRAYSTAFRLHGRGRSRSIAPAAPPVAAAAANVHHGICAGLRRTRPPASNLRKCLPGPQQRLHDRRPRRMPPRTAALCAPPSRIVPGAPTAGSPGQT